MLILPTLLFQLKDQFGVSITQITFLWTICYFLYGAMALPGGFLADKLSYKIILAVFFIGTPAAACVVGAARSVLGLGIGLALLGLFASLYHPSGLAMISHGVRERGKALGLHGMGGNLGLAFSPILAGTIAMRFSWRHAFYFLSLPGFIAGAVFLLISRVSLKEVQPGKVPQESSAQNPSDRPVQRLTIWAIVLLYGAMMLTGFCYRGMITVLPTYLGRFGISPDFQRDLESGVISDNLELKLQNNGISLSQDVNVSSEGTADKWQIKDGNKTYTVMKEGSRLSVYGRHAAKGGLYATMVLLVGMLGQYMGGHFSDRRRKTRLYLLFNGVSLPLMILIGLTPGTLVVMVAALFALFHFAIQPVENNLIAHYTPSRLRSSSYGLKFFLTFGIGSFASGFSGYIADNFGFSSVFLALGGVIVVMVIVIAFLNVAAKEAPVEASQ
jgi:MFS family permease